MSDLSHKIEGFCSRFHEGKSSYGLGDVYKLIIFINKHGDLDCELSSAQYHGCFTLIGQMSRRDIIDGIKKHFGYE